MLLINLGLLAGLVLLYFGAEGLVRGSASLALRCGVTPLVVGLTVVAFGTSAPELVVSTKASYLGQGGIAVGNVVGSNIFNIAVILALSALIRPLAVKMQLIRFDTPIMIALNLLCWGLFADGVLARREAALLFAGIVAYTAGNVVLARREHSREIETEFKEGNPQPTRHLGLDLLLILGGLALLVAGARLFVNASVELARLWGVSDAVIGLTIVAAGTSLPELATSIVAAVRKQEDIAIGNIVGSNVFNILAILGVSGLIHPLESRGVTSVDFGVMIVTSALLLPFMRTRMLVERWEGGLYLTLYGGYLWWLWPK